ncbi:MAG TPA: Mrp/NBP35 family ATP-binding protein [Beijerinckiaceae bacterium]|nr:Mrp/NBP35 family ATP-binding protein [Beijerinckiaceae bacterium]
MSTKDAVLAALGSVPGPDGKTPLTQSGALSDLVVANGKAYFSIAVDPARAGDSEPMRKAAETAAKSVSGIEAAIVTLTAERKAAAQPAKPAAPGAGPAQPQGAKLAVQGVKHIIAVASGKGGVGKSTTACNLALAFTRLGLKVGVLDADIYGPSMPRLFALKGRPTLAGGRTLNPLEGYGVKVMSIGFLVEEDTAMIWRGPMVISAIQQMLREVAWGDLDVLVVDMPPGTGDAQLTMAQNVPLSGAVIVSTPQDLALIDARRGIAMFRKVEVPILGVVENMSTFICPDCGGRHDIFGHGGARDEASRIGAPFLGEVPLAMPIRERSDAGRPIVISEPDGPHAQCYLAIARKVWQGLDAGDARRAAPRIVFD